MFACNPEYEQLRELGRQIMQADPSKASSVQASLGQITKAWDGVQAQLGDKLNNYTAVANAWQQYNDLKQGVIRTLDDVDPLVGSDIAFKTQPEVKKSLDQHKVGYSAFLYHISCVYFYAPGAYSFSPVCLSVSSSSKTFTLAIYW